MGEPRFVRNVLACVALSYIVLFAGPSEAFSADVDELIRTVQAVGTKGAGHEAAQQALKELCQAGPESLVPILRGINAANPLSANWLLNAFETIADRVIKSGGRLPQNELEAFSRDIANQSRARRIAFEWLAKTDPSAPARMIPGMLHDPSAEFRRDAVRGLVTAANQSLKKDQPEDAVRLYQKAMTGATDDDQVKQIVRALKKLGHEVNLQQHFGFLTDWYIVGPFDNKDEKGYAPSYPPENGVDRNATYDGVNGRVAWSPISTEHDYGVVDIAKSVAPLKGVVMYLTTDFVSDRGGEVEFRIGTPNALKVWVNGQLVFAREEYHRGMFLDQNKMSVTLKRGKNQILMKLCQNEQTQDWAQKYQFQFRVCDESGKAVLPAKGIQP